MFMALINIFSVGNTDQEPVPLKVNIWINIELLFNLIIY